MSDAWMPRVHYVRAKSDGGSLKGGAPRVVWQTLGADPQTVSARSAAQRLDRRDQASHLVWNPLNGEIVQLVPVIRAARWLALMDGDGVADRAAGTQLIREGRICAQICVVASGREPFTAGPMVGLQDILTWLDSWGIPRGWPGGPPVAFPDCVAAPRSRRLWARGGHFGASQVPGLQATGPGAIDIERLTGWSAGHAAVPAITAAGPARHDRDDADPNLSEFLGDRVTAAASLSRLR